MQKTDVMHAHMLIIMYTHNVSASMHSRFATNNITGNERDYAAFVPSSLSSSTLGIWKDKTQFYIKSCPSCSSNCWAVCKGLCEPVACSQCFSEMRMFF